MPGIEKFGIRQHIQKSLIIKPERGELGRKTPGTAPARSPAPGSGNGRPAVLFRELSFPFLPGALNATDQETVLAHHVT